MFEGRGKSDREAKKGFSGLRRRSPETLKGNRNEDGGDLGAEKVFLIMGNLLCAR